MFLGFGPFIFLREASCRKALPMGLGAQADHGWVYG